ncbi:T9SS type A sorting domain-containing protein [Flavobacterium sp. xlx-214]|uniref:T9SS type A sorting domain-containing protein n=1 Tax=unclassified Flavobacterium TaxID=196869 RepID=UPI0013D2F27B|nr:MULTISPECIES: T9SS type A sorting domain-containing protein [unclassified Flavobacterium]MBA5791438.1 T9SS type A sorting domain-containing protein [Flavobacterium sp. xlx-221]QMI83411.1 T9SS type A sorting domain-containing protein [Flavobacterium sp. xlx-214]
MKEKLLLILLNVVFSANSQNAALDPTFGNAGISVHPHSNTAELHCFAFDNNDNIVSAGYYLQGGAGSNQRQLTLTKTDKNGILDNTFGTNGKVTTAIGHSEHPEYIVIQSDGKIIVAGSVNFTGGGTGGFVVRYNSDGSLDATFANNGIYTSTSSNIFAFITILSDNSIVLAGNSYLNGESLAILVKLDSNGVEDSQFGTNGIRSLTSTNFKFLMQEAILLTDGTIFCAGYEYSDTVNYSKSAYCKVDTQGNFDTAFGTNGKVVIDFFNYNPITNITEYLHSAGQLPNGQIIVGGFELTSFLLKINSDGSLDNTFGTNGMKILSYSFRPRVMTVQTDGKIIIGSGTGVALGTRKYRIIRFDIDGDLDTTFNNGKGLVDIDVSPGDDWLEHIKLQGNDKLIMGGNSVLNSNHNFTLARLLLDTPLSVENPLEQFIKVYPNPFDDRLYIEDFEGIIKNIKIFDSTGRIVKIVAETNTIYEIPSNFAIGVYYVNIETKDGRIMNKKMIKK